MILLDFSYVVQEDRFKLFKESYSGKSHTFSIARCGNTLHEIVLFTGKTLLDLSAGNG